jgi:hypothetical protein
MPEKEKYKNIITPRFLAVWGKMGQYRSVHMIAEKGTGHDTGTGTLSSHW